MLLPVAGIAGLALSGLLVLGLATVRVGVLAVLIGVVAAVVPVLVVVAALLWIDRWEPEPAKLLLITFAWGACVATLTALLVNDTAQAVGDLLLGTGNGGKVSALVSAPLVEEAVKAVPVILLMLWRSHEFDGVVDGMVYAGLAAAGFAFTENVYYFGRAFVEHGFGDGLSGGIFAAFILRGVLSPFAHPLFTVLIGIGVGLVARSNVRTAKILVPLGAYVGAVLLHALWNASATLGGATVFLNVYFLIMVPIFTAVVLIMVWQRRREQRIIAATLPGMAEAGWIAPSEIPLLSDLSARRKWRKQARKESGRAAARAVGAYQAAVTELAFARRWEGSPASERMRTAYLSRRQVELLAVLKQTRAEAVRLARGGTEG
ncbi:PrsW family intramembrane metalloprotease [Saccharomonospora xinjiangensis]|uniref:Putative membrane protein n=1 Tax=Saccharomonospora xinjiangensis XJ-54 TaxID=882086 RepID=I0V3Q2_9PSEU|nr:PrsW family intramembrane metalloprotease [Saccharomonospora xinjiangensis]EID54755.1 putative membrane protein [Saccharomonospora xinjiangensis XJ-54]